MGLLAPWSLVWLAGVPVLLWLWRLSASSRRVRVPSLIPFEQLLQRRARARSRLILNALFWLQLAALLGLVLALAQPFLLRHRAQTLLIILDTSASMGARAQGSTAFERAKRLLLERARQATRTGDVFLMTTAPIAPLASRATGDMAAIEAAVRAVRSSQLGGSIATTLRIGRALLGAAPDQTLVLTDEPAPSPLPETVRWVTIGEPLPNAAIVGLDAGGSLCHPAMGFEEGTAPPARPGEDQRLVVSVEQFAARPAQATLSARQGARELARVAVSLGAHDRQAVTMPIPDGTHGPVEVVLSAPEDGLAADNLAWVDARRQARWPVVIVGERPGFSRAVSAWLDACQALPRLPSPPATAPYVLVTDQAAGPVPMPAARITFLPPTTPDPVTVPWVMAAHHPIAAYLAPVRTVAARLHAADDRSPAGVAVAWALVDGRRVPLVTAEEQDHLRSVTIGIDPVEGGEQPDALVLFYNALRWVLGEHGVVTAGEPITLSGFEPGPVRVERPDGTAGEAASVDGVTRYEATSAAGWYRFRQGARRADVPVNFLNPVESDLLSRMPGPPLEAERPSPPRDESGRLKHPFARWLIWLACALLLVEWWLYTRRRP